MGKEACSTFRRPSLYDGKLEGSWEQSMLPHEIVMANDRLQYACFKGRKELK